MYGNIIIGRGCRSWLSAVSPLFLVAIGRGRTLGVHPEKVGESALVVEAQYVGNLADGLVARF